MDQLRKAWGWLQRHHFWVLILVAIFVALGCWWSGASALYAEYTKNKSTIEGQFTAASGVQNKPFHPNEAVQAGQTEQITIQQQSVEALWKQLFERQTAEVLKWPANLSPDFREHIQKLKFGDEIPRNLRAQYNNYILDHFPNLPKIVGALEAPEGQSGGMGMGRGMGGGGIDVRNLIEQARGPRGEGGVGGEMPEEQDYIVIWADQQLVRDLLYPRSTPTSKQIWKTQEDLWVYEALLRIIANTNKAAGADRFSNAAVRVIESLEVGKTAALASRGKGRIDMVVTAPAGGMEGMGMEGGGMEAGMMPGAGMEGGMEGSMMGRGEFMGEGGMPGGDPSLLDAELFNNRYVDAAGAPMPSTGSGAPEEFGKEFKRLPVRMRLWMDQRWLPNLITECANAPLQVEVTEVRVNPSENAMGGMGGFGGGRGGEFGGGGTVGSQEMAPESEPQMKSIVIQGIIYIFNPPTTGQPATDPGLASAVE